MWLITSLAAGCDLEFIVTGSWVGLCSIELASSGWSKCCTGAGLLSDVRRLNFTS
jgi:hypothetical protein